MALHEYRMIELDLRERVSRRGRCAGEPESATLQAEINSLLERRNAITGRRAA